MIVIACPGQGSQTPGFFEPWLEVDHFARTIRELQEASGIDLVAHGTTSDADTIRDTAIAQPLIVAAGLASAAALFAGKTAGESGIAGVVGHSVGEITAASVAGVFSAVEAQEFVEVRANAMADAAALEKTGMAAVLGGEQSVVEARLAELDLEPANYNGGGQIVAAGLVSAIAQLQSEPPAGSRVIPLQVAGAFHTRFMQPAVATLGDFAAKQSPSDPTITLWSNAGGVQVADGVDFVHKLVSQVSSPVRWDLCMDAMIAAGVTALIELSPAGTLTGIAKRSMPGVETLALKTPDQIEAAQALIANHS